jgi:hypothetical protein
MAYRLKNASAFSAALAARWPMKELVFLIACSSSPIP